MRTSMLPAVLGLALVACQPEDEGVYDASDWPLGEVIRVEGKGILAELDTAEQGTLTVLRVRGDHYEMGRQMGVLIGDRVPVLWEGLLGSLGSEVGLDVEALEGVLGPIADTVWDGMTPHIPDTQLDLLQGMHEGMGLDEDDPCDVCRIIVLANLSDIHADSLPDAVGTASAGVSSQLAAYYAEGFDAASAMGAPPPSPVDMPFDTCSFFSAWGSRTEGGHLIASRNLDWSSDTGIAPGKAITIVHPEGEGAGHPYATVGYVGMPGALAGLSSAGIAVAEVGSVGVLERLEGEPWTVRHLDILEHATDLDQALAYHTNQVDDGVNRPQTIGYNLMVAWGDPDQEGADAEAAVVEANGAMASVFRGGAAGSSEVVHFAEDGVPVVLAEVPAAPNAEGDAVEIDRSGQPRLFACDGDGEFLTDDDGHYIPDAEGDPMPVGFPLDEALYRGDEAMSHSNRRYQVAANGPQSGDGDGMMIDAGSYRHRYTPSHDILLAYERGTAFHDERDVSRVVVPDNGGEPVLVGLDEGVVLTSHVAMSSNILSVVYDATALSVRVSWEDGTGDDWVAASEREYAHVDLRELFEYE